MNQRYVIIVCVIALVLAGGAFYFWREQKNDSGVYLAPLSRENIDRAIDRGLTFIEEQQQSDGGFLLYVCDVTEPERCDSIQSAVHTAGVIAPLWPLRENTRVHKIVEKAKQFILENMETTPDGKHAVWNLFGKKDKRHDRIPADIDSTSFVAITLKKYGVSFPDDTSALERYKNDGGLFYNWISDTWNKDEKSRHSFGGGSVGDYPDKNYFGVDCVVNADTLSYLSYVGKESPEICQYINNVVENKLYPQCTFYYRNPYLFALAVISGNKDYRVSCTTSSLPKLQDFLTIQEKEDGTWSANIFSNIIATIALLEIGNQGEKVDMAVKQILEKQSEDGEWPTANVFPDLYNPVFYGSEAITTATALSALFLYNK